MQNAVKQRGRKGGATRGGYLGGAAHISQREGTIDVIGTGGGKRGAGKVGHRANDAGSGAARCAEPARAAPPPPPPRSRTRAPLRRGPPCRLLAAASVNAGARTREDVAAVQLPRQVKARQEQTPKVRHTSPSALATLLSANEKKSPTEYELKIDSNARKSTRQYEARSRTQDMDGFKALML